VTFDIDANGILHVTAKDLGTGKEQKITITSSSGLSDEEIEKMVNEAKAHEADDKAAKEKVEVHNHADSMIYQLEKQLKEHADKVPAETKSALEDKIAKLKKDLEADDTEALKAGMKELEELAMKMGEAVYSQQAQNAGAGAPPPPQQEKKNDDGIVDAEVVE
jgi:molecular chaperone DnaK